MTWLTWVFVIALGVFALRNIWTIYEALAHEPKQTGRVGVGLLFLVIDVLLILWLLGVIP
ncbi:hypothetical protein AY599_22750 [Leptolyngbya valderiana BDU 20041]|nr:hypothetical protein AY599_22750 [Leptolyngbya valderiana BDU 20041]